MTVLKTILGYERANACTTRDTRLFLFSRPERDDGFVRVQNIFYITSVIHNIIYAIYLLQVLNSVIIIILNLQRYKIKFKHFLFIYTVIE